MPKKKLLTTIEGFNDELELTQKQIRQLESRNKIQIVFQFNFKEHNGIWFKKWRRGFIPRHQ